jgi:transmembrane sensor
MSKIDNEAIAWVARRFARGLSAAESAQFDAWHAADVRHKGAYARAMAIHNAINLATAPQALSPELSAARARRSGARRDWLRYGAMAACLVASVGTLGTLGLPVLRQDGVLATAKGELRKVPLQDKSIATINSGSRIEVAFTERQRTVKLRKGEAWFEVAKDKTKPFVVEAGDARIRAVGTAFSVRRFGNGTEVLVTEGTVEVWSQGLRGQRRQLTEGESAFLAQDTSAISVSRQPVDVTRKLAWREGKLILKNQTLDDAVADFNRYSPKTIVIVDAALREKRLFGQYKLDAPELFAQDVSTVLDVPIEITADTIFIGRKGDGKLGGI